MSEASLYGLMAEFNDPDALLDATRAASKAGYKNMDAYSPLPVHGLSEALGQSYSKLPWIVFCGGIIGALTGFGLEYWVSVIAFPINVGGRPMNSWPAFIPIMFEVTILFSALTTVISLFALNKLPMPYHPVFNAPGFDRASTDRFFLCIEATDPAFDVGKTRQFLEEQGPNAVSEVEE